jgi:hypothetical protein
MLIILNDNCTNVIPKPPFIDGDYCQEGIAGLFARFM